MAARFENTISTEVGATRIRTRSHFLVFKLPQTTIAADADSRSRASIVTMTWNAHDHPTLHEFHRHVVACVEAHGFTPIKETVGLLYANDPASVSAGRRKLSEILPPEVVPYMKFIG